MSRVTRITFVLQFAFVWLALCALPAIAQPFAGWTSAYALNFDKLVLNQSLDAFVAVFPRPDEFVNPLSNNRKEVRFSGETLGYFYHGDPQRDYSLARKLYVGGGDDAAGAEPRLYRLHFELTGDAQALRPSGLDRDLRLRGERSDRQPRFGPIGPRRDSD